MRRAQQFAQRLTHAQCTDQYGPSAVQSPPTVPPYRPTTPINSLLDLPLLNLQLIDLPDPRDHRHLHATSPPPVHNKVDLQDLGSITDNATARQEPTMSTQVG
ncbi:hypothetical protein V491_00878 [Pseudogymnoascus sp. VKM F-3775]|nr:hypothetical protein V491_00878 [Pseudogymnoascus sp. VKM F-3775]